MDLVTRIQRTRFLGREFLTWLWYRLDLAQDDAPFEIDGVRVDLWFDTRVTLEAPGEIKEQSVLKGETPTETDEARVALQSGKLLREARLRLVAGDKQWTFTLRGDDLSLQGLKVPGLLSREEDDQVHERLALMTEAEDLVDTLFARFLDVRLDDDAWRAEVPAIRAWVFG
jgi:hypothetical protein